MMTAAMVDIAVTATVQGMTVGRTAPTTPALMTEPAHIMGQAAGQAATTLAVRGLLTMTLVLLAAAPATDLLTAIMTTVATFAGVCYTSNAPHRFPCLDRI